MAGIIAGLTKGLIGAGPARMIATPVADLGLKVFGFETQAESERLLSGEAVASTVEGTVLKLMELPESVFEDQLQLAAAVQESFVESAAAYLPDKILHHDLPERETAGEGGVWLLMPRSARPRYRYRKYTRVFPVRISRQAARAILWSDGGTLEGHLLDRGVRRWPLEAEVDLFEAIPGTQFGHLTQDEGTDEAEAADATEFQLLTPDIAGMLLGEPALGRRAGPAPAISRQRPKVGRRYFRIRAVAFARGKAKLRLARRLLLLLEPSRRRLQVQLRISECQAQQMLAMLAPSSPSAKQDLPSVLSALHRIYPTTLPAVLVARMVRHGLIKVAAEAAAP